MIKKLILKKITVISLSFIILLLVYLFPNNEKYNFHTTTTYSNPKTMPIYLIDNQNYVSRFEIIKKNNNPLKLVEEIIGNLTIDNNKNSHIPNQFKKIIPKGTVLIDKELKHNTLKLNFSKEILNIDASLEEKMIEAIVFSLTELDDVKRVMIFVEGVHLKELPHSKKILPNTLDRSFGINKVYEIESFKNVNKVTTYFVNKEDNLLYYTPITLLTNDNKDKIEIIIEKLKSLPTYQTSLTSYLKASSELLNYQILENAINLSFNNEILSLEDYKIIEEVKYSIALSIRDTYDIHKTIFFVDDMLIDVAFL